MKHILFSSHIVSFFSLESWTNSHINWSFNFKGKFQNFLFKCLILFGISSVWVCMCFCVYLWYKIDIQYLVHTLSSNRNLSTGYEMRHKNCVSANETRTKKRTNSRFYLFCRIFVVDIAIRLKIVYWWWRCCYCCCWW